MIKTEHEFTKKIIEVKQVSKSYDGKTVLNNISFFVREGTIHGFIGPNGSGKTTTFGILVGLILPNCGNVYVDGKSVKDDPRFNERLGFVPAEPILPDLSVQEHALDCGYLRDIPKNKVLRKLAGSPLFRLRYQNCRSLSTGQKKILQLFILSLYGPRIFILDEVFNGLDPSFRHDLFNELLRITKEEKGTILISTHILSDLQKFADDEQITFDMTMIKDGKIVYTGKKTPDIEKTYEEYFIKKGKRLFEL